MPQQSTATWSAQVFDGHGRDQCSTFMVARLEQALSHSGPPEDERAVEQLLLNIDREFLAAGLPSGSTGTTCFVEPAIDGSQQLQVVNVGDSRVLLGQIDGQIVPGGQHCTDQALTMDHEPNIPAERQRVIRYGAKVRLIQFGVLDTPCHQSVYALPA